LEPALPQDLGEREPHARVVVDDQDPCHASSTSGPAARGITVAAGSLRTNRAPDGEGASASAPPWAATAARATARPSPVPRTLVVKNGSKMLSACSGGMPGPL